MAKTTLFLGSSTAAKSQARAVAAALASDTIEFLPWWEAFTPGRTLLEELDAIRDKVQGAVLVFSPEAESTVRGTTVWTPNLNVLFEFGYFYGHFRKERVALLRYGEFYLPSDFGGYIHIAGSKFFKRGAVVKVGKRTLTEFTRWIGSAGFEPGPVAEKPKHQMFFVG
jgi:predicted nucleotide-binding protein